MCEFLKGSFFVSDVVYSRDSFTYYTGVSNKSCDIMLEKGYLFRPEVQCDCEGINNLFFLSLLFQAITLKD